MCCFAQISLIQPALSAMVLQGWSLTGHFSTCRFIIVAKGLSASFGGSKIRTVPIHTFLSTVCLRKSEMDSPKPLCSTEAFRGCAGFKFVLKSTEYLLATHIRLRWIP